MRRKAISLSPIAPIVLAAVSLRPGLEDVRQALLDASASVLANMPGARLACVNVIPTSLIAVDENVDAAGDNIHVQRLVELRNWARPLQLPKGKVTYHLLESRNVADGILDVVQHRLLPAANLTTPNQFELELLSGVTIADTQSLRTACAALAGQRRIDVVATGCTLADTAEGQVETILCADGQLSRFATPRLPIRPSGTGDLLTGLIAAHLAKGKAMQAAVRLAVETIFAVLVRTQDAGTAEMRLVPLPIPGRKP